VWQRLLPPLADVADNTTQTGKVGSLGSDGRLIRSYDLDARPTYKSATSSEPARIVVGYDIHLATAIRSVIWTGDVNKAVFNSAPPPLITAINVAPGATNPGPIGLSIFEQSQQIAPCIREVIADRAYTNKRLSFVCPLHQQNIDVVMDYTITEKDHPILIKVGRKGQRLLVSCGTLFSPWLPEELQIPPDGATSAWFADRALWRWTPNQNLKNGGKQCLCPQCAGRVATTAKTRNRRVANAEGPFLGIDNEYCCLGLASVNVDLLGAYQNIPYGTPAWEQSYGRRNSVETRNSVLKSKGALAAGWCRAFGLAAQTIGALALAVAHNLYQLTSILRREQKNGTISEPSVNGTTTLSVSEENFSNALSSRGPP
jgi:hypothetical protein